MIKQFNLFWECYAMFMLTISKRIFSYLDRYYAPSLEEGTLSRVGLNLFDSYLFRACRKKRYFNQYIQDLG